MDKDTKKSLIKRQYSGDLELTKTENYSQERAFVINQLSKESAHLIEYLDNIRMYDTKEYTVTLKLYLSVTRELLRLCSEAEDEEIEAEIATDALEEFNKPSAYDSRGLITL